jgi:hypothetical protein
MWGTGQAAAARLEEAHAMVKRESLRKSAADRRHRRRLSFEKLEQRALLSLSHLYTFNDGSANDWIGAAHGSLLNGATVVDGQLALNNIGVTSGQASMIEYSRLPAGLLPTGRDATIEVWYTAAESAAWARVLDIGTQSAGSGDSYLFFTPRSQADDSQAVLRPAASPERVATGIATDDAIEHMAAIVVDTAADLLRLYIDGSEVSTALLDGADASSVSDSLAYIGRSLFDSDPAFTGSVNELRIYDEALPPGEIAIHAEMGPSVASASPLLRQMEHLGRGLVAMRTGSAAAYIGWRLLGTDPDDIAFNLYRVAAGGTTVKLNVSPLTQTTDFVDTTADLNLANEYFIRPVIDGVEHSPSESFLLAANAPTRQYLSVPLQRPAGGTLVLPPGTQTPPSGTLNYTYNANDAGVGDLDGDGEYEIVLKWDPSNSQDNANEGLTGNVIVDAYKLDGTRLWRIDLGRNIRAGAHYTQFLVYDFDGDGRAEIVMKTADGTIDGTGQVIGNAAADHRDGYSGQGDGRWGRILTGPEFLTVFDGLTGAALSTTSFSPPRGSVASWGDNYGNRVDRFLATVAYLDGVRPSIVMARGYYAKTRLTAFDWRNGELTQRWAFDSTTAGNGIYGGQGNHNLSVGDIDHDGKDEIVYGAAVFDDIGVGLYTTGLGHGDAMHLSDFVPGRPGLEVFQIHEPSNVPGSDLRDARTGQAISTTSIVPSGDEGPGRGVAGDVYAASPGAEYWGSGPGMTNLFSATGATVGRTPGSANFLVWWDADPVRELLDGNHIDKYGLSSDTRLLTASGATSNNGTKSTPSLSADILGDWREEVIWRNTGNTELRIYTTTIPAANRLYTLMHDPTYRMAVAWQSVAYNQPPHTGFFLGAGMNVPPTPPIFVVTGPNGDYNGSGDIDAADFVLWRRTVGSMSDLRADGDHDGIVGQSDYAIWRSNFGAPIAMAATSSSLTELPPSGEAAGTSLLFGFGKQLDSLVEPSRLTGSASPRVERRASFRLATFEKSDALLLSTASNHSRQEVTGPLERAQLRSETYHELAMAPEQSLDAAFATLAHAFSTSVLPGTGTG